MRYSGPVLPEPTLVSESLRGYSQSLTAGPQFESQTNLTQTFLCLIAVMTAPDVKRHCVKIYWGEKNLIDV